MEGNAAAALDFVREHGVVLVSAKGPVPTLTHAIAGEPFKGSWWGHPQGKHIFAVLQQVSGDAGILVCRLVGGKLTLVHSRLWPALAAAAPVLGPARLSRVTEEHTASGRHVNHETPFPAWLPAAAAEQAKAMTPAAALAALGPYFVTKPDQPKACD
jgi:hypothetical protein